MRYSKQHKAQTRERILLEAAALFRLHGFDGVSVDALMEAANLTRGAFYAHFASKEELLGEVMAQDAGLVRMMKDRAATDRQGLNAQAAAILADYLNPAHREEIGHGCPLATMAGDAARGPAALQQGYGDRFAELARQLQRGLGRSQEDESRAIATAVLAVGGVLIARATNDQAAADKVQRACQAQIKNLLQDST